MQTASTVVAIPYRLTFACPNHRVPGRGDAGWTVTRCSDADAARALLLSLPPSSWMPGTHRVAKRLGVSL